MGVPYMGAEMGKHPQYVVVRNERGAEMMGSVAQRLELTPTVSVGGRPLGRAPGRRLHPAGALPACAGWSSAMQAPPPACLVQHRRLSLLS
jgi:hypothetical protein